jgi:hypothetical protein
MSCREWKDSHLFLHKAWRNNTFELHREVGPAYIICYPNGIIEREYFYLEGKLHREEGSALIAYYPDGSIYWEDFYINGNLLGSCKFGFWNLWMQLSEERRQAPNLLKCLSRYS